jgi:hypothetical protein
VREEEYSEAGFASFNILENILPFLIIVSIFVLVIIVLLLLFLVPSLRDKVRK